MSRRVLPDPMIRTRDWGLDTDQSGFSTPNRPRSGRIGYRGREITESERVYRERFGKAEVTGEGWKATYEGRGDEMVSAAAALLMAAVAAARAWQALSSEKKKGR